jgi:hypothetical protein
MVALRDGLSDAHLRLSVEPFRDFFIGRNAIVLSVAHSQGAGARVAMQTRINRGIGTEMSSAFRRAGTEQRRSPKRVRCSGFVSIARNPRPRLNAWLTRCSVPALSF